MSGGCGQLCCIAFRFAALLGGIVGGVYEVKRFVAWRVRDGRDAVQLFVLDERD